jgi:hypothetical protein
VGHLKREVNEQSLENGKYKDLNKLLVDLINGKKEPQERANSQDSAVAKEISSVQASLKDLS